MMEARAEIKEILDELRREKSEKIARRAYSRLAKLEDGFRGEIDKVSDKQKNILKLIGIRLLSAMLL